MNFPRVICDRFYHDNVVLMGDAAATVHFSIGSGSRLAFDSAISLANYLHSEPTMQGAFARYQDERRLEVLRLQSAARNSLEWFEQVERYIDYDPVQFNYALLTRSQRISHENMRMRDPAFVAKAEKWFNKRAGIDSDRPPMFVPFSLRNMDLKNRIVVSPMAQYRAVDGCPLDWHLVHYGERAKGGAGLVYAEMTCVSPEGRITPGCPGLYAPDHMAAWKRIIDFAYAESGTKMCCQIGHANSILMAGRADLVCLDRPHLADPYWTLHTATALGDRQEIWPKPDEAGRDQAWRLADKEMAQVVRV